MARSRNIKPGFFTNELLGTADPMVCLTFAGLWCLADKEGILEDRPLRIKAELFPYRESLDVNGYLTELSRLGFIQRYQHGDSSYIKVLHFRKHQSPHHTEKSKGYPEPDNANSLIQADNRYVTVKQPCNDSELTVPTRSDSLIPDSLITDSPALRGAAAPIPIKPKKPKQTPIPDGFGISERVKSWAAEKGHSNLSARLEHFIGYAKRSGKMYADWDEAFMGAIREDWARLSSRAFEQGAAPSVVKEWLV